MRTASLALALLLAAGCGADGGATADALDVADTGDAADTATADAADTGGAAFTPDFAQSPAVVRVRINHYGAEGDYTTMTATLARTAPPDPYTVAAEDGPCRLLRRAEITCSPACEYPEICTADGVCAGYPEPLSAGAITASDGAESLVMAFDGYGYWLQSQGQPFAPGETVTISAPGDAFGAFSASGVMPDLLVAPDLQATDLTASGDLRFTWDRPAAGGGDAHVRITLNAGYGHGLPLDAVIECDVPDIGAFAVPDALRAELPPPSTWGCGECPESFLTRYRKVTVQAGDTAVDVVLESPLRFYPAWPN